MATLLLSAAGGAIGSQIGGSLLGVSAAAIGQAAGAVAGAVIDRTVLTPSMRRSGPRIDRLHLQSSSEGAALPRLWGRIRVGGSVIWASNFREIVETQDVGGGKGGGGAEVDTYRYTVSFAIAIAEGPIDRIGRVWADGAPFTLTDVEHRLYLGGEEQTPDELIVALEGEDQAPAFRGVAYLVFEDFSLGPFGNRVPQISVEAFRAPPQSDAEPRLASLVKGVALSPGAGEFVLATTPVRRVVKDGVYRTENAHGAGGVVDLVASLDQLQAELPNVETVSLILSWFGTDLRCAQCEIRPGVERLDRVTEPLVWSAGGVSRAAAHVVGEDPSGRPVFGGTPSDGSVIETIKELKARGLRVLVYPFILMDVGPDNTLPDPWSGAVGQPAYPWRGRVTLNSAPGQAGTTDQSAAAEAEVSAFFGDAAAADFSVADGAVAYGGPSAFRYRWFILHCAALAAAAGGVDGFAIGSEMRSLTTIRNGAGSYPAVGELIALAAEARALLGTSTVITYAADWSEYFGHQPPDGSSDLHFHLDPLWADPNIGAVGIDAYFPLADWRRGGSDDEDGAASIYDLDYLRSHVEGGEYYEWYYPSLEARILRDRRAITDGAYGEPWVFRPKDLRAWWSNEHFDRPGGVRSATPTVWEPKSKPIWLTEIGCPAVDRGANQPNVFFDPKSSESASPHFSSGARDDEMQRRYLRAALSYWSGDENPISDVYGAPMLAMDNAYVWTWDARPWPDFPNRTDVWSDGDAHGVGHWITGRLGSAPLADVVAEICASAGVSSVDVAHLTGSVDGLLADRPLAARDLLETLMAAYGFDAVESGGVLRFRMRGGAPVAALDASEMAVDPGTNDAAPPLERVRVEVASRPKSVRMAYVAGGEDYETRVVEVAREIGPGGGASIGDLPLALSEAAARAAATRLLAEAWAGRDEASFALPPSSLALEPTDVVAIETDAGALEHRITRIADDRVRLVEAVRVDRRHVEPRATRETYQAPPAPAVIAPPIAVAMDLPLLRGDENPIAPRFAIFVDPWPGPMRVWRSATDDGYALDTNVSRRATIGRTLTELPSARPNLWTRGTFLDVELSAGGLSSRDRVAVLNGANAIALETPSGDWEVLQFETAVLVGAGAYRLSSLLRGQAGTETLQGAPTPVGARFVLLDRAVVPSTLPQSDLGLERSYRIGAAALPISAESHALVAHTARGAGLRPYAPAHLQARRASDGSLVATWIRRTRIGGDSWEGEAPIGEETERYRLRLSAGDAVLYETETSAPNAIAPAAVVPAGAFHASVAQLSTQLGAGPEAKILVP